VQELKDVREAVAGSMIGMVKAKFHYTSWFGAGSEPVRSMLATKFH